MNSKRGEFNLSFGMIFSIILIIMFLAFGFYGIKALLNMQKQAQLKLFINDFSDNVAELWQSREVNDWEREYTVPANIENICFEKGEFNLRINFKEDPSVSEKIEHLNTAKILEQENPFCINRVNGKIYMILSLEEGEDLVVVKK